MIVRYVDLGRCQPERQIAGVMLDQDSDEALKGTEDGAVQHDWQVLVAVLADIGGAKTARHVQVDLQGAALPVPADGVAQDELQFRSVKSAFARIVRVLEPGNFERFQQRGFSLVPDGSLRPHDFGSVGKFDAHVFKSKRT